LYIKGVSVAGWKTPDDSNAADYWRITRGTSEKALRAVYEVPAAKGFTVGDITIGGRPIEFGAQIVDFIRIKLTGLATRIGQSSAQPVDQCVQLDAGDVPQDVATPAVEDVLSMAYAGGFARR
jgi:hypothetical protein